MVPHPDTPRGGPGVHGGARPCKGWRVLVSPPPPWEMQTPSPSSPATPMAPVGTASAGFPVPQCPGAGCPVPECWCTVLGSRCWVPVVPVPSVLVPSAWPCRGRPEPALPGAATCDKAGTDPGVPALFVLNGGQRAVPGTAAPGHREPAGTWQPVPAPGERRWRTATGKGRPRWRRPPPSFPPRSGHGSPAEPGPFTGTHQRPPAAAPDAPTAPAAPAAPDRPEHRAAPRGRTAPAARGPSPVSPPPP